MDHHLNTMESTSIHSNSIITKSWYRKCPTTGISFWENSNDYFQIYLLLCLAGLFLHHDQ